MVLSALLCCVRPQPAEKALVTCAAVKKKVPEAQEPVPYDPKPDAALIGNMLDHENGPASGLPYQVHYLGPPRPPCEEGRECTVKAIDNMSDQRLSAEDEEITSILKLIKSMFKAPVALVALFDSKRVFVAEGGDGVIPRGDFPWRWTLCAWSLAYNHAQILVIPDTHQDARFKENAKVTGFPYVRFYCGAPLIASNGHRLGTLCFADVEPRPNFDAGSCLVMNNLSEVIVRHLEKDIALKLKQADNEKLQATYGQLQRTLDCFEHCIVLLDTSVEGWRVLHTNAVFGKMTGVDRAAVVGCTLAETFLGFQGMSLPNPELDKAAKQCLDFQVSSASLKPAFLEALKAAGGESIINAARAGRPFTLTFRPAAREGMDDDTIPIGVPAFLKANTTMTASGAAGANNSARSYYFMSVEQPGAAGSKSKGTNSAGNNTSCLTFGSNACETLVEGLELGHLLGRGSYGSVYYATWHGSPVAVKLVDHDMESASLACPVDGAALEAVLGKELRHPNVVQTLKYVHRKVLRANGGTTSISYGPTAGSGHSNRWSSAGPSKGDSAMGSGGPNRKSSLDMPVPDAEGANQLWPVIEFVPEEEAAASESVDWPAIIPPSGANVITSGDTKKTAAEKLKALESANASNTSNGTSLMGQTWLLLEYCDRGCLQEAIDRGWLRTERSVLKGGPNVLAVVQTVLEVARALTYLHSQNVVHGDLSSWNVMLCSSGSQAEVGGRRFVAKVGDFGLARTLELRSRITTRTYGTLTHMPPETLLHGSISKAVDAYSLGVLMWQAYTSSRPWSGLTHAQIINLVASQGAKLQFPDDTPTVYKELALACMSQDPEARPPCDQVVRVLDALRQNLEQDGSSTAVQGEL